MNIRLHRSIITVAVVAALAPSAAQAAPPWSDPTALGQGAAPVVLGDTIAFSGPGSHPGAPLLRSIAGAPASTWDTATGAFDSTFGAFAGDGKAITYVGPKGRRVQIARISGSGWTFLLRGPQTGGARVAAAPGAAVFSTFGPGSVGRVYLVRGNGLAQRLSARGHIRSVAVATNAKGDVLVAWDLRGTIQARLVRGGKPRPVKQLGTVTAANELSVALSDSRRSLVAWVDQRVNEGESGVRARIQESVNLGKRRTLETYPDVTIPSGAGVLTAYTSSAQPIVAWSGRHAVRAIVGSNAAQDVAPIGPDTGYLALGLGDLAVSSDGRALITMGTPTDGNGSGQVLASLLPAGATAFGPATTVSAPGLLYGRSSAGFDPATGQAIAAWSSGGTVSRAIADR